MNPLVTVVLPIYNVEQCLSRCIDSVLNQTYSHLDIILVDDGSPDGCPAICDAYAERDARIRVIHKENGGLSSARNAGIDNATGQYILFIDSDDYVEPNYVETHIQAMVDNHADIVTVNLKAVGEMTQKERVMDIHSEVRTFPKYDLFTILQLYPNQVSIYACNNLYSMDILNAHHLRFSPTQEVLSEDQLFNLCYYASVRTAVYIDRSLYNYHVHSNSLSRSKSPIDILNRWTLLVRRLKAYIQTNHFDKQAPSAYAYLLWAFFASGCRVFSTPEETLQAIAAIEPKNRAFLNSCLRKMLLGKASRTYIRKYNMDRHAVLYFRFMLILMLFGRYDRPVRTYLWSKKS